MRPKFLFGWLKFGINGRLEVSSNHHTICRNLCNDLKDLSITLFVSLSELFWVIFFHLGAMKCLLAKDMQLFFSSESIMINKVFTIFKCNIIQGIGHVPGHISHRCCDKVDIWAEDTVTGISHLSPHNNQFLKRRGIL